MSALDVLKQLQEKQKAKPPAAPPKPGGFSLSASDFAPLSKASTQPPETILRDYQETERGDFRIERASKDTLERMIKEAGMEEEFTFFTRLDQGRIYVNNMRVFLSRVKNKLRSARKPFKEFKLVIISVKRCPKDGVDQVTVIRHDPRVPRSLQSTAELEKLLVFGEDQ